jgi:hypothetical protein
MAALVTADVEPTPDVPYVQSKVWVCDSHLRVRPRVVATLAVCTAISTTRSSLYGSTGALLFIELLNRN